ncbi:hypothetical protein QBC33DRAFT_551754 [Phialemonium atrogriseum]|uniref:Zn(2)-C6 fungal-type domain-containing protein n=1 Tax=Phialemonium atrogriseum TaxID=1093897 RepID=A0AAJ0BR56_9PEZI|nr:uncharacterized protein QBC33DRAFT_551754 [Phialemonium atrogriseum]KAK1762527.1 hypothetical protein QBC33DRAFT_551754 [Phialemonium atrogriseum]
MPDDQERIASGNPEASHHYCPLCKRTFARESTRKRHYYYCRSKLPDTNTSRKRSCAACVRAKARCIRPADTGLESCVRCNERGANCEFDAAARRNGAPPPGAKDWEIQGSSTTLTLTRRPSRSGNLQVSTLPQTYPDIAAPLSRQSADINIWDADFFGEIGPLGLESTPVENQGIDSLLSGFSGAPPDMLVTGTSSFTPWTIQLSGPSPFEHRAFTRLSEGPLVSLAMRILRSYPFMMLQKAALPPFISPVLFSWAETGMGPPQQALITCVDLVNLFKSRTESDRNVIWRLIRLEQERILAKHANFDRWELLAAFQALLVYCLLRLHEVPVGHDGLEASLLTTVNLVFSALASSAGGTHKMCVPDDPGLSWTDWIFSESMRRTVLIFQILDILVEISTEASSYANCGLLLIPLATSATLWNAEDPEGWRTEFRLCDKRTTYALSQTGVLTRLQVTDTGVTFSAAEWEGWRAEVGDIGTLVMIIGALR